MTFSPYETNSPLVVDADGMLSVPLAPQRFKPVTRRHPKIVEALCIINETELPQSDGLNVRRKPSAAPTFPDRGCFSVPKSGDHAPLLRITLYVSTHYFG